MWVKRSDIEIRHLRYVIAAAEHGSFRLAAAAIGVQASAVSRRIRDVEDKIGAALFIRQSNGVRLTYAGELFLQRARRAMSHIRSAEKDVASAGQGDEGRISVGISFSLASKFMASLIGNYTTRHAKVRLEFSEGGPTEHIQAIRTHQLDVAFLTGSPQVSSCVTRQLWSEQVYVAMPKDDDLVARESISWSDLHERQFVVSEAWPGPDIHDLLIKHLSEPGHQPFVEIQAVYRDNLMQMVASGGKLTLVSEAATVMQFPGVLYRQLANETVPFCAVWSPTNDNPAFRRFLSLARRLSAEQLAVGKQSSRRQR